jgi:hypothetical protein
VETVGVNPRIQQVKSNITRRIVSDYLRTGEAKNASEAVADPNSA